MKIRTVDEFIDRLDAESAWRKQELTNLHFSLKDGRDGYKDLIIRSSVALSYAHWEGFIKNASEYFLIFLSARKLKGSEASKVLQRSYLHAKVGTFSDLKGIEPFANFMSFCETQFPETVLYWDPKKFISTKSNLNFDVFSDILGKIGVELAPYETKKHKIDALLSLRNSVAHGERPTITADNALEYLAIIRELIEAFKADLLNLIAEERFRSAA